jgi:AcrR family transcriptional regulator
MTTASSRRETYRVSTGESGRYLHPDVRRRQIVDAASVVFAEKGFPATRISDIAAEANIAQGTIYRFFDSKEDIAKALFEVSEQIGRAALERILHEAPYGDAKSVLARYIAWYARFLAERRRIVAALFAWEVDTSGRSGSDIGWRHWIGEQLDRLLREAGVEKLEGTDMGRLLPLLIYALTALSNLHGEDSQEDEEALGRRIIDIVQRLFGIEIELWDVAQ